MCACVQSKTMVMMILFHLIGKCVFQPFTVTLLTRLRPRVDVGGDEDAPLGRTERVLGIDTRLCTITSTTFCKHSNIT